MEAVLEELRRSPAEGKDVLDALLAHDDPEIRSWVPWAAPRVLGGEAVPLLLRLARGSDGDTSDAALEELLELDAAAAATLRDSLREKLFSEDFYAPVSAMWALAQIGDRSALDLVDEASEAWDNTLHRNTAAAVRMLFESPDELVARVERHEDHDRMPWLAKAARILGTPAARAALAAGASTAPDEECRRICSEDLRRFTPRHRGT
jgi:hypothetical protein